MNTQQRQGFVVNAFRQRRGTAPTMWGRAPGRVDLMGSHTDYNQGYVMTMTLDRDTWLAARPRTDRRVHITSLNLEGGCEFSLDSIEHETDEDAAWTNYVRGVANVLQNAGYTLAGFDGLIHSIVPLGSGLSSSAALEMAVAMVFQGVSGFRLNGVEMARLGQHAENQFVGVNCGILDQYSSAMGREGCALLLDCQTLTHHDVPIHGDLQVVICDTKAPRNLIGTEYADRRRQCEEGVRLLQQRQPAISSLRDVSLEFFERYAQDLPAVVAKRCRFIIEENVRVLALRGALARGDTQTLHQLFHGSYVGARDGYEIGAPAMDAMMDAMEHGPGVVAARQAGAGFGGCMVALVAQPRVEQFVSTVAEVYASKTTVQPSIYPVRAAPGASLLPM